MNSSQASRRGFGFPYWRGLSVGELVETSAAARHAGFASAWASEVAGPDPWVVLGATAVAVPGLELGTGLLQLGTRSPATVATAALTTAQLTQRPFSVGLGVSTRQIIEGWHGTEYAPVRGRLREYVSVLRAVLTGTPTACEGFHFRSHGYRSAVDAQPVTIHLGGLGDKMVRTVGEIGDGLVLGNVGPELACAKAVIYRQSAEEHGRPPGPVHVLVRACVSDRPAGAVAWMRREIVRYCNAPAYRRLFAELGYAHVVSEVRTRATVGDRSGAIEAVPLDLVSEIAAIGDASAVQERLEEYERAGVRVVVVPFDSDDRISVERCAHTLRALGAAGTGP